MNFRSLIVLALLIQLSSSCDGQLFGNARQIGRPLQRQQGAGQDTANAGNIRGNERFLRNNRRRGDFVGSDRFEPRGFVGKEQGRTSGPVLQSTVGVRPAIDRSRQINQPLPTPARNQAYHSSLRLDFEVSGIRFPNELKRELENPAYFDPANRYEVLVEGRQATLRGVVADAKQRDLAELLVSFEPGISVVKNELQVAKPFLSATVK